MFRTATFQGTIIGKLGYIAKKQRRLGVIDATTWSIQYNIEMKNSRRERVREISLQVTNEAQNNSDHLYSEICVRTGRKNYFKVIRIGCYIWEPPHLHFVENSIYMASYTQRPEKACALDQVVVSLSWPTRL